MIIENTTRILHRFIICVGFYIVSVAAAQEDQPHHHLLRGGGDSMDGHRKLYESDDDERCLESAGCRMAMGFIMICLAPLIICWNEHTHARLAKLYKVAEKQIEEIDDEEQRNLNSTIDGAFVKVSGTLGGAVNLQDELFPYVKAPNAILLKREIEIYQYKEVKKKDDYSLKEVWSKRPLPDPKHNNQNNPIGNWEILSSKTNLIDTGDTLNGFPIKFGDNVVAQRAPNPILGQSFSIPKSLLDEAFFGTRNVYRLREFGRLRDFQGVWTPIKIPFGTELHLDSSKDLITCFSDGDGYVYDGTPTKIGTIRMKWSLVSPQALTVAAEAVKPGRPCVGAYYGGEIHNMDSDGELTVLTKFKSAARELFDDESRPLLSAKKKQIVNEKMWTFTPYSVTTASNILPPYDGKFLGQLWMIAPGLLSSSTLFRRAHWANDRTLFKYRGLTYALLFIGWILLLTTPISSMLGTGFFASILAASFGFVAFILATSCWMTVSALACCTAKPLRSTLLVCGILSLLYYLRNSSLPDYVTQ